ncbi:uncharacterized protein SAPINGB_P004770 [Magnusiomyces paraingens]|uniref:Uncharacterized protein n=1 Tax=Magnusiomyces paraingens TaxID=2606893 RepID=A0A5E8BXL7_9ASCO|nr:uncharacterized protein SAPINGB_P004770 [Saprochaete ingens]VVT55851.1 unnamed protein product [Saprochaete ingens]
MRADQLCIQPFKQARVDPPARGLHFQTIGKADSRGNCSELQPMKIKKSPGTPDFFISVIDTKEFNVPTLEQTLSLLDNVHVKGYKIKNPVKNNDKSQKVRGLTIPQQMNLLKRGYRNIIIAAVDSGIINMTSVADVPFGQEHVYYPYN